MPHDKSDISKAVKGTVGPRRASEGDWKDYLAVLPQPIVILDPDHTVVSVNHAALKALNGTEGEVLGRKCHELFHGSPTPAPGCPMERVLSDGSSTLIEMEMETLHGTFLVSCTPMIDETAKIVRIVHTATDITNL